MKRKHRYKFLYLEEHNIIDLMMDIDILRK
jgi:hypothetical protein